jgi:pyruvate kinase
MLSAETAAGKYPVKAVQAMAEVIVGAERFQLGRPIVGRSEGEFSNTEEAIAKAVMYTAGHMHVRAIVALTESGLTALWMSRIRADMPIFAFTRQLVTRNRVTLYRGVYPVRADITHENAERMYRRCSTSRWLGLLDVGDQII